MDGIVCRDHLNLEFHLYKATSELTDNNIAGLTRRDWVQTVLGFGAAASFGLWMLVERREGDLTVPEVDSRQASKLIAKGALVLDVRDSDAFESSHIAQALSMPVEVLRDSPPAWLADYKSKDIVVYCKAGCANGYNATKILLDTGFTKAVNLYRGIDGWRQGGFTVVSNSPNSKFQIKSID